MKKEHLMIIDDDEGLRSITALALRRRGHEVTEAASTNLALRRMMLAAQSQSPISAVLTDLSSAGPAGADVLRRMKGFGINIPVLYLSGGPGEHGLPATKLRFQAEGFLALAQSGTTTTETSNLAIRRAV